MTRNPLQIAGTLALQALKLASCLTPPGEAAAEMNSSGVDADVIEQALECDLGAHVAGVEDLVGL